MKALGNILVILSGLSTQLPFILLYKDNDFLPPFDGGKTLYLISIEILCIVIFSMLLLNKKNVHAYLDSVFSKKIYLLLVVFFVSGLVYSVLLLNFVFDDGTQRMVIPIFHEEKMSTYLLKSPTEQDITSIAEYIQENAFNKNMWFLTYVVFFILYCIFFSSAIALVGMVGIRLLGKEPVVPDSVAWP